MVKNKDLVELKEIKLRGITARIEKKAESDSDSNQIGKVLSKYFGENISAGIKNRKSPGRTFCVYTNYEKDFTGEYDYFVGEEVSGFGEPAEGLKELTLPESSYAKFTVGPGSMPGLCIEAWGAIWKKTPEDLGGARAYIADFEIYDERSADPSKAIFDIYIGIKK